MFAKRAGMLEKWCLGKGFHRKSVLQAIGVVCHEKCLVQCCNPIVETVCLSGCDSRGRCEVVFKVFVDLICLWIMGWAALIRRIKARVSWSAVEA